MNVDDLISELEDLCGDLSDTKGVKKTQVNSTTTSVSTNSFPTSTYSGQNQKNISSTYNNSYTTSNKYGDDDDDDFFKPTSTATKPQYQQENKSNEEVYTAKYTQNNQNRGTGDIDDLLDILQSEDYGVQKNKINSQQNYTPSNTTSEQPNKNLKQTTCLNPYLCNGDSDYANDDYNMKKRVCNSLRRKYQNFCMQQMQIMQYSDHQIGQLQVGFRCRSIILQKQLLKKRNAFNSKNYWKLSGVFEISKHQYKNKQKAISDNNYSSYSCQCRGTSVNKLSTLSECNMQEWRCMGHFD